MSLKTVDARGVACPRPLIMTREALQGMDSGLLTVVVDNVPARENVLRFLGKQNIGKTSWTEDTEAPGIFTIKADINSQGKSSADTKNRENPDTQNTPGQSQTTYDQTCRTVFIGTDRIGTGPEELGKLLLKGFVYTLTQVETRPEALVLMNSGVTLALQDSESLSDLQTLVKDGMSLMVCGTCLDFLGVREQLGAGVISNMYDITEVLLAGNLLTVP